jgi:hypothetical protein
MVREWNAWHAARRRAPRVPYAVATACAAVQQHHLLTAYFSPLNSTVKLVALDVDQVLIQADARGCSEAPRLARALAAAAPRAASSASASAAPAQAAVTEPPAPAPASAAAPQAPAAGGGGGGPGSQLLQAGELPSLQAALGLVWPGGDPLNQLRRVAAEALLAATSLSINKADMGNLFKTRVPLVRQEVAELKLEDILGDANFSSHAPQHQGGQMLFRLELAQLRSSVEQAGQRGSADEPRSAAAAGGAGARAFQLALRPAAAQAAAEAPAKAAPGPSSGSPSSGSPSSSSSSPRAQLSASARDKLKLGAGLVWPSGDALSQLRRVAAQALLGAPSLAIRKADMARLLKRQAEGAPHELKHLRVEEVLGDEHLSQEQLQDGELSFSVDLVRLLSSMEALVMGAAAGPS